MHVWRMNASCLCLLACACASRPADDDCADEHMWGSWVWVVEGELILLCDTLCSTFAAGETTRLAWGIPCE